MIEQFLNFEKGNIILFAKELLSDYYVEEFFNLLLDQYIENRYYNYFDNEDVEKSFDDNIMDSLEKKFISLSEGTDPETQKKLVENYLVFNFVMCFDGVTYVEESVFLSLLCKYRKKLFKKDEDKIFQEDILKIINTSNKKREKFYKYFETKDFYLLENQTNRYDVTDITLRYSIEFPKLYSEYAIDRVFDSDSISEEKMFIEYQLVTEKILKDIKNCNFEKNYLLEFPEALLANKDALKGILDTFNNDCFKNQSVFKIKYEDYCKHGSAIKDMIKSGYLLAIELDDEDKIEDLIIFNIFKYIIVSSGSKYCNNASINDKIIII
jgi:hypothetical protein